MDEPFRVTYPGNVLRRFDELCTEASQLGSLSDVLKAASEIHRELQTSPVEFGDPSYTFEATQQEVFVRMVRPLVVYYAVHRKLRIVVVKSLDWLPSSAKKR